MDVRVDASNPLLWIVGFIIVLIWVTLIIIAVLYTAAVFAGQIVWTRVQGTDSYARYRARGEHRA